MGVSYKGNGGGNRGRPYGLMLLVTFGTALLGVMVLHKLRERRVFNLLVIEKDRELFSLQLLLQKERENTKEIRRRTEEMKAKMYFLRNQKMELDSRLLEMQSTIDSLKDEQKAMESALEEKQNEIRMLRETEGNLGEENSQVIAVAESLKQKEDEIQDSRHHPEYPAKVWSVNTDDPSNPTLNLTASNSVNQTSVINDSKQQERPPDEVTSTENGGNSTRSKDGSENMFSNSIMHENTSPDEATNKNGMVIINNMGGMTREEQPQKMQNSHQQDITDGGAAGRSIEEVENGNSKDVVETGSHEMSIANSGEAMMYIGGKGVKTKDAETEMILNDDEQHKAARDAQPGKLEHLSAGQNWNSKSTSKGGMKLDQADNSVGTVAKARVKQGHLRKTKGKRWTMVEKNRPLKNRGNSEDSEAATTRSQNILDDVTNRLYIREGVPTIDVEKEKREVGKNKPTRARKTMESSTAYLLKLQPPEDTGNLEHEAVNVDTNDRVGAVLKRPQTFQNNQMIARESTKGESHTVNSDEKKPNLDDAKQTEEHDGGDIHERTEGGDLNNKQEKEASKGIQIKLEAPEDMEVADTQGDSDLDKNEFFRNSGSSLEEDNEEYKEETDESEF